MAQEQMTQAEIDALQQSIFLGDLEDPAVAAFHSTEDKKALKATYRSVVTASARYEYALMSGTFEDAKEARKNLHRAAFNNWLLKNGLSRDEYYRLMNQEAIKRGMRPPFRMRGY